MDYCCARQHAQPPFVHTYNTTWWNGIHWCVVCTGESTCLTIHHNLRTRAHTQTHTRTEPFTLEWTFVRAPSFPRWLYLRHVSSLPLFLSARISGLFAPSLLTHLVQLENEKENNGWTMFLSPRAHRYDHKGEKSRAKYRKKKMYKINTVNYIPVFRTQYYLLCVCFDWMFKSNLFFRCLDFFLSILSDMLVQHIYSMHILHPTKPTTTTTTTKKTSSERRQRWWRRRRCWRRTESIFTIYTQHKTRCGATVVLQPSQWKSLRFVRSVD